MKTLSKDEIENNGFGSCKLKNPIVVYGQYKLGWKI